MSLFLRISSMRGAHTPAAAVRRVNVGFRVYFLGNASTVWNPFSPVAMMSPPTSRSPPPFFNNYRPQFYFRTTDVTGVITLPEGVEMCMPGDNVDMKVELITPIAIENGLRFAIREGGRTVGSGVVVAIEE